MAAEPLVLSELMRQRATSETAALHTPPSVDHRLPFENSDEDEDVLWEGPY